MDKVDFRPPDKVVSAETWPQWCDGNVIDLGSLVDQLRDEVPVLWFTKLDESAAEIIDDARSGWAGAPFNEPVDEGVATAARAASARATNGGYYAGRAILGTDDGAFG